MRRLPTLISALLILAATATASVAADKRVALVIGNSAYQNVASLANPAQDANAVAELFKSLGFDAVEVRRDLGSVDLKRALRDFTFASHDAAVAVIFFAGHGLEVAGTNYLVPVDAKLANDIDVEDEAVSLDRVLRALEPATRLRLVILDACRDNPFVKTMQRTAGTRSIARGLAKIEPPVADTLVAYAARAGSTADDGSGPHSPFTVALLKHLAEPGLDVQLALRRVRDDVLQRTGRKQEPFVYGSLGGAEISLAPKRAQTATRGEPTAGEEAERAKDPAKPAGPPDRTVLVPPVEPPPAAPPLGPPGASIDLVVASHAQLNKDCSLAGSPTVRITTQPRNGRVAVAPGPYDTRRAAPSSFIAKCRASIGNSLPGIRLVYTPNPGFSGTDTVSYTVTFRQDWSDTRRVAVSCARGRCSKVD